MQKCQGFGARLSNMSLCCIPVICERTAFSLVSFAFSLSFFLSYTVYFVLQLNDFQLFTFDLRIVIWQFHCSQPRLKDKWTDW